MSLDPNAYRDQFPFTAKWNYLNHATHGPFSTSTTQAVCELVQGWQSPPDLDHSGNDRTVQAVRTMIAGLINGRPENVAFTGSLAESISLAASGIDWKPGDNCVIPEFEFPSVVYPFLNLVHRGVEVRFAPKAV
jgi:cysteine desulfurase / selenocysteine lyase